VDIDHGPSQDPFEEILHPGDTGKICRLHGRGPLASGNAPLPDPRLYLCL